MNHYTPINPFVRTKRSHAAHATAKSLPSLVLSPSPSILDIGTAVDHGGGGGADVGGGGGPLSAEQLEQLLVASRGHTRPGSESSADSDSWLDIIPKQDMLQIVAKIPWLTALQRRNGSVHIFHVETCRRVTADIASIWSFFESVSSAEEEEGVGSAGVEQEPREQRSSASISAAEDVEQSPPNETAPQNDSYFGSLFYGEEEEEEQGDNDNWLGGLGVYFEQEAPAPPPPKPKRLISDFEPFEKRERLMAKLDVADVLIARLARTRRFKSVQQVELLVSTVAAWIARRWELLPPEDESLWYYGTGVVHSVETLPVVPAHEKTDTQNVPEPVPLDGRRVFHLKQPRRSSVSETGAPPKPQKDRTETELFRDELAPLYLPFAADHAIQKLGRDPRDAGDVVRTHCLSHPSVYSGIA